MLGFNFRRGPYLQDELAEKALPRCPDAEPEDSCVYRSKERTIQPPTALRYEFRNLANIDQLPGM
jgi:hypothetical protein